MPRPRYQTKDAPHAIQSRKSFASRGGGQRQGGGGGGGGGRVNYHNSKTKPERLLPRILKNAATQQPCFHSPPSPEKTAQKRRCRQFGEVCRHVTSPSHMRMPHILLHWNVIPSSCRPTPHLAVCPVLYAAASTVRIVSPLSKTRDRPPLRLKNLSPMSAGAVARSPPRTARRGCWERGTALRHWDAVSRQSGTASRTAAQNATQSREHVVYLLFSSH